MLCGEPQQYKIDEELQKLAINVHCSSCYCSRIIFLGMLGAREERTALGWRETDYRFFLRHLNKLRRRALAAIW